MQVGAVEDRQSEKPHELALDMVTARHIPRIVIAALKGGAGKTLISIGITAAMHKRGYKVAPFKKGPDYIDSAWLGIAAGAPCYNLDRYLAGTQGVRNSFAIHTIGSDLAVVEGNRGLFDGVDAVGSYSTADLARILQAPVALIVDATKMTRTAAALVLGCQRLERDVGLAGVILNKVAGERHKNVLREAIEDSTGLPILGCIDKLMWSQLPQRHLGLLPICEHPDSQKFITQTAEIIERQLKLDFLLSIARNAPPLLFPPIDERPNRQVPPLENRVTIGIVRDSAFQFYYPENLEALRKQGAELIEISALKDKTLPDIHALYIGGGFPEIYAETLASNEKFKTALKQAIEAGLPVYAECGGLMYLCQSIVIDHKIFPMVNIFPARAVLQRTPQGLGYITVKVVRENPFYKLGKVLTGHEFHYSTLAPENSPSREYAFEVIRGAGVGNHKDGLFYRNVLGTYLHLHALGEGAWASGIISAARRFASRDSTVHVNDPKCAQD